VGLAPLGATYIVIACEGAPPGAGLRIEAVWEEHAKMRWAVVKVDREGKVRAELPITSLERGTEAQKSIVGLEGVSELVVVGVNLGEPRQPFDPDDGPRREAQEQVVWEPHGWLLTVAQEP
jgi:hypothetical protein